MPLKGLAKKDYQHGYMQDRRARERADREFTNDDRDVLRLAVAGYPLEEITSVLGLSEEATQSALDRVAEYLCPSPASRSVECVALTENATAVGR